MRHFCSYQQVNFGMLAIFNFQRRAVHEFVTDPVVKCGVKFGTAFAVVKDLKNQLIINNQ